MNNELHNIEISITLEDTEDGRMYIGRCKDLPDVVLFAHTPGEVYWLVVDAIRAIISSRNPG